MLNDLIHRLRALFKRETVEREVDDELRFHVERQVEKYRQAGQEHAEALRRARLDFGGLDQIKEEYRDSLGVRLIDDLRRDVQLATRALRKAPSFALAAVGTLTLGIGITVTTFTIVYSVLWKPLPYPNADRLVAIEMDARGRTRLGPALDELRDLGTRSRLLTRFATINGVYAFLDIDGRLDHVHAASVSDDLLPLLGAEPLALGRVLSEKQDVANEMAAGVVISDRVWRTYLGADPNAIGRRIKANGLDVAVVGVLRPDFRAYLPAAVNASENIDLFWPDSWYKSRGPRRSPALAALAPGATIERAQAEVDAIAREFVRDYPRSYPAGQLHLWVRPLREMVGRDVRPALIALAGAVAFVLAVVWVNVATLLIGRAKVRERELAVKRALGATRGRLLRQLFIEGLVLASIGGAGGLLAAIVAVRAFGRMFPGHLPRESAIAVDLTVVLFAVGVTVLTTLALATLPALQSGRTDAVSLRSGRTSAATSRRRLQRTLLVAEIALTVIPLIAAGLMLRTFVNLARAPIGFDPNEILTAKMSLSARAYPDRDQRWRIIHEAVERVRHLPGVSAASAVSALPFSPLQTLRPYAGAGEAVTPDRLAAVQSTFAGYFQVVGTRLVRGRDFTDADVTTRRNVAIVDERLATLLGEGDMIGKHVRLGQPNLDLEIVGIVNAVRSIRVRDADVPTVFVPFHLGPLDMSLVVRAERAHELGPAVRATIAALGTGRPLYDVRPMTDYVADSIATERLAVSVLAIFGGTTLLLAAVGLYGTVSYLLSTRRQEFGVRLALGATPAALRRLVSREALTLALIGIALGLGGGLGLGRALGGLLYGVAPADTITVVAVAVLVAVVALVAAAQPAWRASRVDPAVTLRSD